MGFKDFESKGEAIYAMKNQSMLAACDLAPRVYSDVRKIDYLDDCGVKRRSNWGFVTEIAKTIDDEDYEARYDDDGNFHDSVSNLIFEMKNKCDINFGDSHSRNVGWVKRGKEEVLVCIDTGRESFSGEYRYP
jgi:hypothetical protein